MKKILVSLSLIISVCFFNFVFAENDVTSKNSTVKTSISGKIVDKKTGEALVGVSVTVNNSDKLIYTDLDGNFNIENLNCGTCKISASFISYSKNEIENIKIENGKTNSITIELERVTDIK